MSMCGTTSIRGSSAPFVDGTTPVSTNAPNQAAAAAPSASTTPTSQADNQLGMKDVGMY